MLPSPQICPLMAAALGFVDAMEKAIRRAGFPKRKILQGCLDIDIGNGPRLQRIHREDKLGARSILRRSYRRRLLVRTQPAELHEAALDGTSCSLMFVGERPNRSAFVEG